MLLFFEKVCLFSIANKIALYLRHNRLKYLASGQKNCRQKYRIFLLVSSKFKSFLNIFVSDYVEKLSIFKVFVFFCCFLGSFVLFCRSVAVFDVQFAI